MAALLALAGPLTFFTGALSVMRSATAVDVARLGTWWMFHGASLWCLLLATGYGSERLMRRHGQGLRAAIWLLAACSAAAFTSILTAGRVTILIEQGLVQSARAMHLNGFTFSLIMALLYFAHLHRSRQHRQAAARLAAAQSAQREARRRIVQARLQGMQARIDPQLLFELLDTLRRLYAADAARAERFLDELIGFLRGALPRLRSEWSSLLREVELVRTFGRLRALASSDAPAMRVDIAPEAMHARFPPGVLLPLLGGALDAGAVPIRLTAARSSDGRAVLVTFAAAPPETSVARVRSLLAGLYGTSGTLEIAGAASAAGADHVIVEVPYELA